MTDNLRIWSALEKTDPKHTKNFKRAGGFSGTAMKPIWLVKRLTELFGPCGAGWGMGMPEFQTVAAGDEVLVFCTVALWYMNGAEQSAHIYGVGGDKVLGKNKYGPFTNDEAFKASYTDALSNAMKQIGVGADIHMGLFDDEKYVRETAREFAHAPATQAPDLAQDEDVKQGAINWMRDERGSLNVMTIAEEVKDWRKRKAKPLAKLEANYPDIYEQLMQTYDLALERVTGRVQ
jgi:hypothetical protein